MDNQPHILADGFSSIRVNSYNPSLLSFEPEQQRALDEYVASETERQQKRGGTFYNGPLVAAVMNSFSVEGKQLVFDTQATNYGQHAGLFRKDPLAPIHAVYINGLVLTSDNMITFGTTQATEADWMGKLGIPAGAQTVGPDGYVSLAAQLYRELSEEVFLAPDYHLNNSNITPGWILSKSPREGFHHLTVSFVVPITLSQRELVDYFNDVKSAQERYLSSLLARGVEKKVEFKDLRFLPNDADVLKTFVKEQDAKGKNANILGKSLDVIDVWSRVYGCDVANLRSKPEACVYPLV